MRFRKLPKNRSARSKSIVKFQSAHSWIQTFAAIVSSICLIYSLALNRDALEVARTANQNTLNLATQEQSNTKKQLSAKVSVETAVIQVTRNRVWLHPTFSIYGDTQASNIVGEFYGTLIYHERSKDVPIGMLVNEDLSNLKTNPFVLVPGSKSEPDELDFAGDFKFDKKYQSIFLNTTNQYSLIVIFQGTIKWKDEFRDTHSTNVAIYCDTWTKTEYPEFIGNAKIYFY